MKYEISRADCKFLKSLTIYLNNEDAERLNLIVDNYIKQREKLIRSTQQKLKINVLQTHSMLDKKTL